jgi:hypothetical protein
MKIPEFLARSVDLCMHVTLHDCQVMADNLQNGYLPDHYSTYFAVAYLLPVRIYYRRQITKAVFDLGTPSRPFSFLSTYGFSVLRTYRYY